LLFSYSASISFAQDTYIQCGKIIDTKTGKVLTNKTIVVSNKTIKTIQDGFINPKSKDKIVDLKPRPCAWVDMHVHLEEKLVPPNMSRNLPKMMLM
jgi:adenine deaminase